MNASKLSLRYAVAAAALFVTLTATPSFAFRMIQNTNTGSVTAGFAVACNDAGGFTHWNNAIINWRLNTANQGSGKGGAISNAITSWVNVTNAEHTPTYTGTTTDGFVTDGLNTVVWATGNGCTGNCLALTALVLQTGQVIVEADITFNDSFTWTTNGTDFDTEAVAVHELGHTLGIHHTELTTTPEPSMRTPYFGQGGRSLEADDRAALRCAQTNYPVQLPGPPAPASLTVEPLLCLGWVDLSWSSSTGATSYQLQQSLSSTFSNVVTIYNGPDTLLTTNGTGTRYFRVRACNADGCSAWRNGSRSAPYYSICL